MNLSKRALVIAPVLLVLLGLKGPELSMQETLKQRIESEIKRQPGTFAVAFKDLQTNETLLINEKEVFHAASTMKTPVMVEVFRQVSEGKFRLNDPVTVKNNFSSIVDGSSFSLTAEDDSEQSLYGKVGSEVSIYNLMYDMIIQSSNLATNLIIELVKAENVMKTIRSLGINDMQVRRGVEDTKAFQKGLNNTTTAYDLMLLFEKMAKGELINQASSEAMVRILLDQKFKDKIPGLLPPEVKVAHKTGWITGVTHDCGIVYLPDGRKYVLVLLSKGMSGKDKEATALLAQISRMIYDQVSRS